MDMSMFNRVPTKWRVVAHRRVNGIRQERDLGIFEAYVGHKARSKAAAQSKLPGKGWYFRIYLVKE